MTAKEYLHQAYRLDNKIDSDIEELHRLRQMAASVSSSQWGERVQSSRGTDAPFVRSIEKIMDMEEKINREIDILVDLKEQMRGVISSVRNTNEQMVLRYRYINNYTWEQIGNAFAVNRATVWRWYKAALNNVVLPKNPIKVVTNATFCNETQQGSL